MGQDVDIRRSLGGDQERLRSARTRGEFVAAGPAGLDQGTVLPDHVQVQIGEALGKQPQCRIRMEEIDQRCFRLRAGVIIAGIMPPKKRKPPKKAVGQKGLSLTDMARQSMEPVDPELFLWCQGVYYAAASMAMPVQNPEYTKVPLNEKGEFFFTDRPENRGMLAVVKELRE